MSTFDRGEEDIRRAVLISSDWFSLKTMQLLRESDIQGMEVAEFHRRLSALRDQFVDHVIANMPVRR